MAPPRKPRKSGPKPPAGAGRGARAKSTARKATGTPQKIKLRGRDERAMTVAEACQGLYEAIRVIQGFDASCRLKWASLYFVAIDQDGNEVTLVPGGEIVLNPYQCAADEFGV